MQKYYELLKIKCKTYTGTFGYTNHIERTANSLNISSQELIDVSTKSIIESFNLLGVKNDYFLHYNEYENNKTISQSIAQELFEKLKLSGFLFEKTIKHPFDVNTNEFVFESFVSGNCPNCNAITIAYECEKCGLFQDECKLLNPFHSDTKEKLEVREAKRLYLKIDEDFIHRFSLKLYENNTYNAHVLHDAMKDYLAKGFLSEIPITTFRKTGVVMGDREIASMPMDRAFSDYYIWKQLGIKECKQHIVFRGIDNICASGIFAPYILYIAGVPIDFLPITIASNFYLLENEKFSTSRNHAIWFNDFARSNNVGLIRFYLAKTASTFFSNNFDIENFNNYTAELKSNLLILCTSANDAFLELGVVKIESGQFTNTDLIYYKTIKSMLELCLTACEKFDFANYIQKIESMMRELIAYSKNSYYAKVTYNKRTRAYLSLYSLKIFSIAIFPVLTEISDQILVSLNITTKDTTLNVFDAPKFENLITFIENL